MRLLHIGTLEIVEFSGDKIPPYAILSHTWGDGEVSFENMKTGETEGKEGLSKIKRCSEQAAIDGYEYFWVDTCCIDKRSSSELSEAINSMYRWYQNADVCYAYLADVDNLGDSGLSFKNSWWFTRGWTLQELLAPKSVKFYSGAWKFLGTKGSLSAMVSNATSIDNRVIKGAKSFLDVSIAQRMSWAATRHTTRDEDIACCLMGMFGVNMPLLYGEGRQAFIRLQEAIMKDSDDQSLFAWTDTRHNEDHSRGFGLLASSPAAFAGSYEYCRAYSQKPTAPYSITNKGLQIELLLCHYTRNVEGRTSYDDSDRLAVLDCQVGLSQFSCLGIHLKKSSEGENEYHRIRPWSIVHIPPGMVPAGKMTTIYVRKASARLSPAGQLNWRLLISESHPVVHGCRSEEVYHLGIWDAKTRTLSQKHDRVGPLATIKYGIDPYAVKLVVIVGFNPPSRLWCSIQRYIRGMNSLKDYFESFIDADSCSNESRLLWSRGHSYEAIARIRPSITAGPGPDFVLDVSVRTIQ